MSEPEAGPALDALIAARVFGIKRLYYPSGPLWPQYIPSGKPWRTHQIDAQPLPRFSQDIAAAWAIVERLRGQGWRVSICELLTSNYEVTFEHSGQLIGRDSDTISDAICRAALAVVEWTS